MTLGPSMNHPNSSTCREIRNSSTCSSMAFESSTPGSLKVCPAQVSQDLGRDLEVVLGAFGRGRGGGGGGGGASPSFGLYFLPKMRGSPFRKLRMPKMSRSFRGGMQPQMRQEGPTAPAFWPFGKYVAQNADGQRGWVGRKPRASRG